MADAGTLTEQERHVLRQYGRGDDLGDIAKQLGETRERVGQIAIRLCNLNRNRARELSRDHPPARPLRATRPDRDVDPAELDRVDQAFAEVFARKSPQLAVLVDAARALSAKAKQTGSAFFQTPWGETTQLRRALAALDGTDPDMPETRVAVIPVLGKVPEGTHAIAEIMPPSPEPLERWSAHRCATCRWIGPFIDDYQHTDCPGQPEPVALLVLPRDVPCQP